MRMLTADWGDGVDDNGGSPRTTKKTYLDVTWSFPSTAPNPDHFEIAIYTGTGPDDLANYVMPVQTAPGADRRLVVSISPTASVTGINASVRAVYA